uniref:Uncharacterized protein n=1 Tax=Physcomitrium patens TaxID=3218 RepID=A0A2K1KN68_PHYPA|nr:hypothetical protein PHYPA_006118 [Physcomitrium patens]
MIVEGFISGWHLRAVHASNPATLQTSQGCHCHYCVTICNWQSSHSAFRFASTSRVATLEGTCSASHSMNNRVRSIRMILTVPQTRTSSQGCTLQEG